MSRPRYVLVGEDRVPTLHRFPAFEECNLDDGKIVNRFRTLGQLSNVPYHACLHCKPLELDESDEPEDPTETVSDSDGEPPKRGRKKPA